MSKILDRIKEREKVTGYKIVQNPYTLGADIVVVETGIVVHSASSIECEIIMQRYEKAFHSKPENHE